MVAIDLANVSASQAFDLSTEAVGRATHQIVGGPQGLDESVYVALRRAGLANDVSPRRRSSATTSPRRSLATGR